MKNSIEFKSRLTKINLEVAIIKDDDYIVAYSPALDIAGQGMNEKEALDDLMEVVSISIDWAVEHDTFDKWLEKNGWKKIETPQVSYTPPPMVSINLLKSKFNVDTIGTKKIPMLAMA